MFALTTNETELLVACLGVAGMFITAAGAVVASIMGVRNRRDVKQINAAVNNVTPGQPKLVDVNTEQLAKLHSIESKLDDHLIEAMHRDELIGHQARIIAGLKADLSIAATRLAVLESHIDVRPPRLTLEED